MRKYTTIREAVIAAVEATVTLVVAVIGVGAWLLAGYRIAQLFGG